MLLLITWRNLWRHRARSLAIIASVSLGVWAGVFIVSIYYGMGKERKRIAIEQEVSHLQIHHPNFRNDYEAAWNFKLDSVEAVLRSIPAIKAWSLRTCLQGMLANAAGSNGVQINGIEPAEEAATRQFPNFIKSGSYLEAGKKNQILVGKKLAEKMKLALGAKIVLTFQDREQNIGSGAFRIAGIYESNNAPLDERNVYVHRSDLNVLLGTVGCGTEAAIMLHQEDDIPLVLANLQQRLPQLEVLSWQTISPETALIMSALDTSAVIIIAIILLALAFGIINTMLMAVLERTRELGMLMAVGMTKVRLFSMIVLETVLLTLVGCPIGFGIAWIVNSWLSKTGIDLTAIAGNVVKDFGYGAIIYPDLPTHTILQIIQMVCLTALLASVFPAWKALKLKPAEAIRR